MIRKLLTNSEARLQFLKFIVVGMLNTAISLAVIYVCMFLGMYYKIANLTGYAVGVINSFIWNKHWVFRAKGGNVYREIGLFGITFLICYGVQYLMLLLLVNQLEVNTYISQFLAMGIYTVSNFLLNRLITFKK